MQTLTELYNLALTAVGGSPDVTDPEGNFGNDAVCRLHYPMSRRNVMRAYHWPSLRRVARLERYAELDTTSDWSEQMPARGWAFAHVLPADCLIPVHLDTYSRFTLGVVNGQRVVYTNSAHPILHYTADVADPESWDSGLFEAVVYALAANLAIGITGKTSIAQNMLNRVKSLILPELESLANAEDTYDEALPSLWAGTGNTAPAVATTARYYYPVDSFNVAVFGSGK